MSVRLIGDKLRVHRRKRRRPSLDQLRLSELHMLKAARYGEFTHLPETNEGRAMLKAIMVHIELGVGAERRLEDAAIQLCPWLKATELRELVQHTLVRKRPSADALAWSIKLNAADRATLRIRTIGACDLPKAQRAKLRRTRAKGRDTARRRAKGAKPRDEYLKDSISAAKPWIAQGISRRTWYRIRNKTTSS